MKKGLLIALLFVVFAKANAQEKKNDYYFLPQIGLLNGDQYASGQVLFSGGIQTKSIAFGLGVGMEYYKIRTVPLFAEVRAAIGKKKKTFAYVNAGPSFVWALESQTSTHFLVTGGQSKDAFKTGVYGDVGLGYKFLVSHKNELLLSLGYSVKTLHQSYSESVFNEFPPYVWTTRERSFDYTLNRIAFRMGIKL